MRKTKKPWGKILLITLAAVLAVAVVAEAVWLYNGLDIQLSLNGQEDMTVEFGSPFEDPGVQAQLSGRLFGFSQEKSQLHMQQQGEVDTGRLGNYSLTYLVTAQLNYGWGKLNFENSIQRTVHVVDTTPPQITLHTDPNAYTLPGSSYVEEGFTATDLHDGDLTGAVTVWTEADTVHYRVEDSSGNVSEAQRPIVYSDPVPPELTLQGKQTMVVLVGSTYTEPGFTAVDNLDGDLSGSVTVTGQVDTGAMGTYALEYTVTDSYGNTATVNRTVIVRDYPKLPADMPAGNGKEPAQPDGKVIYLTFDDGPSYYTEELLDILKKYNVKATFFVVDRGYANTLRRIVAEGHTLGMHCGTHSYGEIYASEEAYFRDLKRIQDTILRETGVLTTIVRFPGGSSNTVSKFNPGIMTRLTKMLDAMNYRYFDWNVSAGDSSSSKTPEDVFERVTKGIGNRKTAVVLQHDIKYFSIQAVEDIIKWGKKHGYQFLPLTDDSPTCESRVNN